MRFYIHSEEEPSFALPVQWDDADTRPVEALLQHFLAAYAAKGGKRSAAQIALSSSDGRLLAPKARVLAVVEDGYVQYYGRQGPWGYDPREVEAWLAARFPTVPRARV